jgi:hypothetical protein
MNSPVFVQLAGGGKSLLFSLAACFGKITLCITNISNKQQLQVNASTASI